MQGGAGDKLAGFVVAALRAGRGVIAKDELFKIRLAFGAVEFINGHGVLLLENIINAAGIYPLKSGYF